MQQSTNARADPNVDEPDLDGDGAAHRNLELRHVVEGLKLGEDIQRDVVPSGYGTNIEAHVYRAAAHDTFRSNGKIYASTDINHTPKREGYSDTLNCRIPCWRFVGSVVSTNREDEVAGMRAGMEPVDECKASSQSAIRDENMRCGGEHRLDREVSLDGIDLRKHPYFSVEERCIWIDITRQLGFSVRKDRDYRALFSHLQHQYSRDR